MENLAKKTVN